MKTARLCWVCFDLAHLVLVLPRMWLLPLHRRALSRHLSYDQMNSGSLAAAEVLIAVAFWAVVRFALRGLRFVCRRCEAVSPSSGGGDAVLALFWGVLHE